MMKIRFTSDRCPINCRINGRAFHVTASNYSPGFHEPPRAYTIVAVPTEGVATHLSEDFSSDSACRDAWRNGFEVRKDQATGSSELSVVLDALIAGGEVEVLEP